MEILVLVVVALFSYIVGGLAGWRAREKHAIRVASQLIEKVEKQSESLIPITIEQHNGVFYIYNKKDKSFMAQGKNAGELEEVLTDRFPGKKFSASEEELQKAGLLP